MTRSAAEADNFDEAIRRIRAGDDNAAAELVRKYEPLIRREVRLHLEDQRLRRVFDSMDVAQSVLASFFIRVAAGEYELERPEQLIALLVRMTHNKLVSATRKHYRHRRDARRAEDNDDNLQRIADDDPTPSEQIANQELLAALRKELTDEECRLTDLRAYGLSWDDIAVRLGGKAQARRMQLSRGIQRAARKLGLDDLHE